MAERGGENRAWHSCRRHLPAQPLCFRRRQTTGEEGTLRAAAARQGLPWLDDLLRHGSSPRRACGLVPKRRRGRLFGHHQHRKGWHAGPSAPWETGRHGLQAHQLSNMKLGLGTVQFGLDYGVANSTGKVPPSEVSRILALAAREGFAVLDTAHLYGESERVLGETLVPDTPFHIVTKTPKFGVTPILETHADMLEQAAESSLRLMRLSRLYGLLIHHAPDALADGSDRLFERLMCLKESRRIEKIGVSVYDLDELEAILDRHPIDLVQLPFSVIDQRL